MTPEKFKETFAPICVAAMLKNGGFASVRLAQIALESGWGESEPIDIYTGKRSYNLTGVKGVGPAGSVKAWTHEWDGSKYVKVLAEFRAYHSYEEHIFERDKIFEWSNYDAYRAAKTPEEAVYALVNAPKPYATDPNYASKLLKIINDHNFKIYDRYIFVDVGPDHPFYNELKAMKERGYVRGRSDGYLALSEEAVRVLVIAWRMFNDVRAS